MEKVLEEAFSVNQGAGPSCAIVPVEDLLNNETLQSEPTIDKGKSKGVRRRTKSTWHVYLPCWTCMQGIESSRLHFQAARF